MLLSRPSIYPPLPLAVLMACYALMMGAEGAGPTRTQSISTHSLQPPFLASPVDQQNWVFGGNAIVKKTEYIRLTADAPSQMGYIYSTRPFDAQAWSVEFDFSISGYNNLFGDGMVFWYTDRPFESGTVYGNRDKFTGLAVIMDTYPNADHPHSFPYISAMVGDGKMAYDHDHDNTGSMAGHGCEANIRGSGIITAQIIYYENHVLQLKLKHKTEDQEWKECFAVSNATLPRNGYIGFTAATGALSDAHDLRRVVTLKLDHETYAGSVVDSHLHDDVAYEKPTERFVVRAFWWLFKAVAFAGALIGGYVLYKRVNKKDTKRF